MESDTKQNSPQAECDAELNELRRRLQMSGCDQRDLYISRLLGGGKVQLFGDLIEAKFLSTSLNEWNVGSALSLVMMILILLSLGLLQKVDPEGEGGGMI